MKVKDIELGPDCPLAPYCNSKNCGSPDTCFLAGWFSKEEMEMELEDMIVELSGKSLRDIEYAEAEAKRKDIRRQAAKKAAHTKFLISIDPDVIKAYAELKKIRKGLDMLEHLYNPYAREKWDELIERHVVAMDLLRQARKAALKRIKGSR